MRAGWSWALALAGVLALAGCADRPDPPRAANGPPQLVYAPPGTEMTLENTVNRIVEERSITVAEPQGPRGTYVSDEGEPGSVYPGCWGCGGAMRIDEAAYAALWPLETGRQVAFLRTAPDGAQARVAIRVSGRNRIETPAGAFDAWALDGRIESVTGPPYSAQVRAWWAPDPGWVVRVDGGDSLGNALSSQVIGIDLP